MSGYTIAITVLFSLFIALFGFLVVLVCMTLCYKCYDAYDESRRFRRSERERIQRTTEAREIVTAHGETELPPSEPEVGFQPNETHCQSEKPVMWEVRADKYPEPTSKWEDLLVRLRFAPSSVPFHSWPI